MSRSSERFGYAEGDIAVAPCATCARKSPWGPSCAAFPRGIPVEIRRGEHQHRVPFPGDGGLTYQPSEPEPTP